MMPGMNSRQAQQMMKRMGIKQVEIDADQVIIISKDKKTIIDNPEVSKVNMMGQETYQVVGSAREENLNSSPDISEEDIKTIVDQTGCSKEKAKETLEKFDGDLAESIIELSK